MVIVLALLSSAILGSADFVGGIAARRARSSVVVLWSNAAGLVSAMAIVALLPGRFTTGDLGWGLLAGLCGSAGAVMLYRALAAGVMSVVAPTTAAAAALVPGLAGLLHGEEVTATAAAGAAAAFTAMVLISRRSQGSAASDGLTRGIGSALLAGVSFGGFLVMLARTADEAASWPLVFARCSSLPILLLVLLGSGISLRMPVSATRLALLSGVLDMVSNVLFLLVIRNGHLVLIGLLASLSPVGTIGLARILLKERLRAPQQVGAVLAICSVLLLAVS
jgi:drug/metabolite transporter (DMT)-like permease